jgi:bifunctional pyridoxal-dependent enzyme with beta-cystathionase and maltose regulon repressor activities
VVADDPSRWDEKPERPLPLNVAELDAGFNPHLVCRQISHRAYALAQGYTGDAERVRENGAALTSRVGGHF